MKLLKLIYGNTTAAGYCNTPLLLLDRSAVITSVETRDKNEELKDRGLLNIYRTLHPPKQVCTFFSSAHGNSQDRSYIRA